MDYQPFGGILWQSAPTPRLSFIDKEKDKESGLSEFGVRKYDDELGRFMSVDALWEEYRSETPYHYVGNNPLTLIDPTGKGKDTPTNIDGGLSLPIPSMAPTVTPLQVVGGIISAITGWFVAEHATTTPIDGSSESALPDKPYYPERALPIDKGTGKAIPDADAPHTQLGERKSRSRPGESYPQSREFDENGNRVRDIDWTDHGRPKNHSNPHQHRYDPETGKRGDPEPLEPVHGMVGTSIPSPD